MTYIEANEAAIDAMRALDPNESIIMLNLLKFRDKALDGFGVDGLSGGEAFRRYGELNDEEKQLLETSRGHVKEVMDALDNMSK